MPFKKDNKKEIGSNNMTGTRAKDVMKGMKELIGVCFDRKYDQLGENKTEKNKIRNKNKMYRGLYLQLMDYWLPLTLLFAQRKDFDKRW